MRSRFLAVAALASLGACSTPTAVTAPDLATQAGDLASSITDLAALALPGWMLEDVQPLSPRANQTYGLDAFRGKPIVVTILQGF